MVRQDFAHEVPQLRDGRACGNWWADAGCAQSLQTLGRGIFWCERLGSRRVS